MTKVELSLFIEESYPANKMSIAMRKPMCGVGVNDADYMTTPRVNGVKLWDPAYRAWVNMLQRAYDPKFHATHQTYIGVTVCEEWHSFSAFRAWWLSRSVDGWQLDKDLLVYGNKQYGPDNCVFVPNWLNSFTVDRGASRGRWPIGVSFHAYSGLYTARCSNPITGEVSFLGYFRLAESAYQSWVEKKLRLADELRNLMDAIDHRIYKNVVSIIKSSK